MKRSPLAFSRMPPSPRTASVIRIPAPATPVGWNCQNSMSSSGMPARAAMPRPSPVLMKALVEAWKMRPAPPVASSTVLACSTCRSPVSISSAVTPTTSPSASRIRSSAIHSTKKLVLASEPVAALDGVVEVVVPVVLGHVAQRGADAALRRHRVRAGGEHLGQHGHVQAGEGQLEGGAHAGAAGAHDDDVELARRDVALGVCHCSFLRPATAPGWPSP